MLAARGWMLWIAAVSWLVAAPVSAETGRVTAPLPGGGTLELSLPADWKPAIEPLDAATHVEVLPRESGDFRFLLTLFPLPPDSPIRSAEELKDAVAASGTPALAGAVQTELELVELTGEGVHGYLYHLTDRNPERGPGDYREAHQGMLRLGDFLALVTVLTHSDDTAVIERAREVLAAARVVAARGE